MAATIQAQVGHGVGPTLTNAETGIVFNRSDDELTTSPIPIPTATGTNYSWLKWLCLAVTATSTTNITNRQVNWASAPTTGLTGNFQGTATYAQATSGNMPAAAGTNGAVPASFTAMSTTPQTYDAASVATSATGKNGNYCETVLGVGNNYAGGAGSGISLPNIVVTYQEA